MENRLVIVGITGAFGSGKSTAADFFESLGFRKITLSWFLEEEIKNKKEETHITRKMLQDLGNDLRKQYGSGVLAKKALNYLKREKIQKAVVDGIRNVGEIDVLRENANFVLLAIVADRAVRFERLKHLKRREDLTEEVFAKLDRRDLGLGQKETGLQVAACQALADIFIDNNGEQAEFTKKLEQFLKNRKLL